MYNPFSFRGSIGRGRLWFTWLGLGLADNFLVLLPVSGSTTTSKLGRLDYVTPLDPPSVENWLYAIVFYAAIVGNLWIVAAALVRRLHDHAVSGWWVAVFFASLLFGLAVSPTLTNPGRPITTLDAVIFGLCIAPAAVIGSIGSLMVFYAPGVGIYKPLPPNDLRRYAIER